MRAFTLVTVSVIAALGGCGVDGARIVEVESEIAVFHASFNDVDFTGLCEAYLGSLEDVDSCAGTLERLHESVGEIGEFSLVEVSESATADGTVVIATVQADSTRQAGLLETFAWLDVEGELRLLRYVVGDEELTIGRPQ